jgi:hypothetical protein
MSIYYQTLKTMTEATLPPTHQSWHDFNRAFFGAGDGMEEFVTEYLDWHSGVQSFLEDEDNMTVKKSLDSYGGRFLMELQNCTMLDLSIIVEKMALILYE